MTGVPKRGLSSLLGATWLALALLHGVLQELAPRSVLGDPLLPFWAKLCLFATEGALMGGALLGTAAVVRGLALVAPRRLSPGIPVLRCLIASTLLLILSVSWSMFWLSGQFLDGPGLRFAAGNFSSLFAYAAKVHPFLALGMPWLLVAGAVAASLLVPRGIERLRPEASFWTGAVAVGLFILAVLLAAAGELARRRSTLKITDPATGAVYSRGELYRLRRD